MLVVGVDILGLGSLVVFPLALNKTLKATRNVCLPLTSVSSSYSLCFLLSPAHVYALLNNAKPYKETLTWDFIK